MDTNSKQTANVTTDYVDVNSPEFYKTVQYEINTDIAQLMKTMQILINLRLEAAELEAETAAMYHSELWRALEDAKEVVNEK